MGKLISNLMKNYIANLDGIRALAVLVVIVSHAGFGHLVPGGFGVTVFFFLSGYLITSLLLKEQEKNKKINFKYFYIRRGLRLFPPLIVVLVIAYSLAGVGFLGGETSVAAFLSQLFYLANYSSIFGWGFETPNGLGILWSLAVEEHFYIIFPFLFAYFVQLNRQYFVSTIIFGCLLALLWRCYLVYFVGVEPVRTYYATDTRFDSILYGVLLAILMKRPLSRKVQLEVKGYLLISFSIAILLFTFFYRNAEFRETFRYSLQGLALMPLFFYCINAPKAFLFSWLEAKPIKMIGIYSYSMYLIHFIIIELIRELLPNSSGYMVLAGAMFGSLIFAYLNARFVDRYFLHLKKRFND